MYTLNVTDQAKKDIAYLKKNGGKAVTNKVEKLLVELIEHPKTGTCQIEQLKGDLQGQWSRRIDKKN
jgi:toxin YoeB